MGCYFFIAMIADAQHLRRLNHAKYLRLIKRADLELQRARANMENDQLRRFFYSTREVWLRQRVASARPCNIINNTSKKESMRSSYANYESPNLKYDTMTAGVWCQPELTGQAPPSLLQKHFDFSQIERMRSIYTPGVQASTCYSGYSPVQALNVPYTNVNNYQSIVGSYLTDTENIRQRTMLSNPSYGTMRRR